MTSVFQSTETDKLKTIKLNQNITACKKDCDRLWQLKLPDYCYLNAFQKLNKILSRLYF